MIRNETIECRDRESLRKIQSIRLKKIVDYVYHNTPFYRKKMQEMGITPDDINSIDDIVKLPFTTKHDLRDNYPFGLCAVPMSQIVRIHASSGTTGKPTVVGYTRKDLSSWAECISRAFTAYGAGRSDIFQVSYGYGLFTGGLGAHAGAENIGASVIPMSIGITEKQITLMHDFGSTVLCCTPSYALYLAGFDVKDVHMTDLASGRETLEDVYMIVFCGGFSNSDVLGSAKGWAGGFLFNENAKKALDNFYARPDTLSLGICNGCQLMMDLVPINPEHEKKGKMLHNDSHKFESTYVGLTITTNRSVMFGSLSGSKLGLWGAHGEGKFSLPYDEDQNNEVAKYSYDEYPGNPNGSDYSIAGLASADGRHLAMMPHLERAIFPWLNGCYPADRKNSDQITPWIEAFVNARKWVEEKTK